MPQRLSKRIVAEMTVFSSVVYRLAAMLALGRPWVHTVVDEWRLPPLAALVLYALGVSFTESSSGLGDGPRTSVMPSLTIGDGLLFVGFVVAVIPRLLTFRVTFPGQATMSSTETWILIAVIAVEDCSNFVSMDPTPWVGLPKLRHHTRLVAVLDRAGSFVKWLPVLQGAGDIFPLMSQAAIVNAPRLGDCAWRGTPLY